jgi:uncharacterized repeat protein (TIGR03803 family)
MKKTLLITLLLTASSYLFTLHAQMLGKLWGTTNKGGAPGGGVAFNYNPQTMQDSITYNFSAGGEYGYYGNCIQANDGNLYGVTYEGGYYNYGVIYRYNPSTKDYTTIHSFNYNTDGGYGIGSLMQASNDTLYGMTYEGGANGAGTIFKCSLDGAFSIVYNFGSEPDADYPYANSLIEYNDTLYGMTYYGGSGISTYGVGAIFKCSFSGNESVIHTFGSGSDGYDPYGSLTVVNDTLYGMTEAGGTSGYGIIFRCTTSGGYYNILHNFSGNPDGAYPYGNLLLGANDTLYGTTEGGGANNYGTLFSCSLNGNVTVIHNFSGTDGEYPYGNVIEANDTLYGVTYGGGANTYGVIFKCTTSGTLGVLYNFTGTGGDAEYPYNSLVLASNDTLYGSTYYGGAQGYGTLYSCSLTGTESVVHSFTSFSETPFSNLLQASDGNLYGVTEYGGANGYGSVFKINPQGVLTTIYSFTNGNDGGEPYGGLIEANNDTIYGTTDIGGANGYGTIFSLSLSGNFSVLYTMGTNAGDGYYPVGNLLLGTNDTLYGMDFSGGANGDGTIFSCSLNGTETTLYSFTAGSDGKWPYSGLVEASNDTLYGMTKIGGTNNKGIIFSCSLNGGETVLHTFGSGSDGNSPYGGLVLGKNDTLYGITEDGGSNTLGTIFSCSLNGTENVIYNFAGGTSDGKYPHVTTPLLASNDTLYGLAYEGGTYNYGTLFKCSLNGNESTVLNFNDSNGAYPDFTSLTEAMSANITDSIMNCSTQRLTARVSGGGGGGFSYMWSNGATTSSIDVASGTYSVWISNEAQNAVIADTINTTLPTINNTITAFGDSLVSNQGGAGTSYQWLTCGTPDVPIVGATHKYYNATATGNYAVITTIGPNCVDTASCQSVIITGIKNLSAQNGVSIYPMPTSGMFNMSLAGSGYKSVTVYDEMGKAVFTQSLQDESLNSTLSIDMSNCANGIYFAQIVTGNGTINRKVVIQK